MYLSYIIITQRIMDRIFYIQGIIKQYFDLVDLSNLLYLSFRAIMKELMRISGKLSEFFSHYCREYSWCYCYQIVKIIRFIQFSKKLVEVLASNLLLCDDFRDFRDFVWIFMTCWLFRLIIVLGISFLFFLFW